MLRVAIFVATSLLVGCPSKQPEAPRVPEDTPLRIRIAQAEARRGAGVDELIELRTTGDVHARVLALRGLGRIGGAKALAVLEQALDDKDPQVVAAALYAIGLAASLDDLDAATQMRLSDKILASLLGAPLPAIEALGRAGNTTVQRQLATKLADKDVAIATAAAFALGRHGRRKIGWSAEVRVEVAKATVHADARVRYAATYALSREHEPPADDTVNAALVARIPDGDPETRASAIAGLARRKALAAGRKQIEESLRDRDWRVAAEAVRALAGPNGDEAGRSAVAASLAQRMGELTKGNATEAQIVTEALRALVAHPTSNNTALATVLHMVSGSGGASLAPVTKGWIECLAIAASLVSASAGTASPTGTSPTGTSPGTTKPSGTSPAGSTNPTGTGGTVAAKSPIALDAVTSCGSGGLPDHLRLPLLAEVAKHGDLNTKRAALRVLLAHDDPRVRAAGLTMLPSTWKDSDAKAQATTIGTVTSALATKNQIVAGTAIDVAGELHELTPPGDPMRTTLETALISRANSETDVELAASLYALLGKRALPGAADVCRAGLSGAPARAKAAAECLRALGEASAAAPTAAAEPPPADVATVIGRKLLWHLATTRGEVVIELRPDVAPWAVASIVALTKRGFYDGLEFHRVVPNFVVQGGDPTQSGWGGPGYTLPAEPASGADGPGYVAGGVGIADAGRDSGGSQWFIMHSRAPHLDGRYTWIGSVVSGQKSADTLLIGDKVVKATIEQR